MLRLISLALALGLPGAVCAMTLDIPGHASLTSEMTEGFDSHPVAISPFADGTIQTVAAEGAYNRQLWRIQPSGLTTLQILQPLRDQIAEAGYEIVFECQADQCGGYDFRFATATATEPEMHVDLGDFRYLAARQDDGWITLMISRSSAAGFLQISRIGVGDDTLSITTSTKAPADIAPSLSGLVAELVATGRASLDDLTFETGSANLGDEGFASLTALADFLKGTPGSRVVLVGHTDAEGSLEGNIALSRKRAEAVAARLVQRHGIEGAQISAQGVGFLAPRASNDTTDGRTLNRRVEVVLADQG